MEARPLSSEELKHSEFISGESAPRGQGMQFVNGRWQRIEFGSIGRENRAEHDEDELDRQLAELLGRNEAPDAANDELLDDDSAATNSSRNPAAAPVPAHAPPPGAPLYLFPVNEGPVSADLTALTAIYDEFRRTDDYAAVRDAFCAVSIELNRNALWAPAFRPQPRPRPPAAGKGRADQVLHCDRVVIDLHWLRCRKEAHVADQAFLPYQHLLDTDVDFDFALASAYAARELRSRERAEVHIGLAPEVQWQLATLKSEAHAVEHSRIYSGGRDGTKRVRPAKTDVVKGIASWAARTPALRGQADAYVRLWAARRMLGKTARAWQIAELAALMNGTAPLEASTVRQKLGRLDSNVPAARV
ncbi:MAG: hypothetical protein HY854_12900 [Burkholderiales bacterium]|nr:hypothetical protein [Burkholderiales bacterium]